MFWGLQEGFDEYSITFRTFWHFLKASYILRAMESAVTTVAFTLYRPETPETAVIFSSPHSGKAYSDSFLQASILDAQTVRSSEDAFVDELFLPALAYGAPLLVAHAPRAFIDLNRGVDELDGAVIEGARTNPHNPRVASGLGVIPRVVSAGRPIYRGKISITEAESRLNQHWYPFHAALHQLIEDTRSRFGQAILLDCHSMPHDAIESTMRDLSARPDVVLGDRFGASAMPELTEEIAAAFREEGLRVARNAPFAGAYIAQAYGRPSLGVSVIQIEIDRALYMDELTVTPRADFAAFRALIGRVQARILGHLAQDLPLAAE